MAHLSQEVALDSRESVFDVVAGGLPELGRLISAYHHTAAELTGLEGVYEQGTNLHHALALATRHLRRHPNAQPVILVVTDGEPTAHLEDFDGDG